VSEERPPQLPRRRRLDVEQPIGIGGVAQRGALVIYALATVALVGVAFYMALIEQRPLMSGWVAGPAIGALWFGLRVFMIWGSKD
jgi:hypothetical protein